MGKLTDMVAEPVSLPDRLKISAKRMRLAGIGLFSKVDAERSRLYQQALEMGDSYGDRDSLVGQLTRISTGTVNLMIEESQRLFDELVEAGEQVLAGEQANKPAPASRLTTPRPVAKPAAPKLVSAKSVAAEKPAVAEKPAKPAKAASSASKPSLKSVSAKKSDKAEKPAVKPAEAPALTMPAEELRQKFEQAKSRLNTLTSPPDQATMLTLYSLFKQATEGDVAGRRPGPTKLVERAKFDERQKIKGMNLVEAMERYIATVDRLFVTEPA